MFFSTNHLFSARFGVVGKDVNAVAGSDGDEALELPFALRFDVLQKGEFAAENLDEEVAVAAGGLKEAAVELERLVVHQVAHGVHLAGIGEHLAMLSHPLAAFDLGFRVLVVEHKKSVKLSVWNGGSAKPLTTNKKAHGYSVSVSLSCVVNLEICRFPLTLTLFDVFFLIH